MTRAETEQRNLCCGQITMVARVVQRGHVDVDEVCVCVCRRYQKPYDRLRTAAIRHMKEHDNRTILSPPNKLLFQMFFSSLCVYKCFYTKMKGKKLFFIHWNCRNFLVSHQTNEPELSNIFSAIASPSKQLKLMPIRNGIRKCWCESRMW